MQADGLSASEHHAQHYQVKHRHMCKCRTRNTPTLDYHLRALLGNGDDNCRLRSNKAYVSIRQHTSAYISIRQHTSVYVRIRQHTSAYADYEAT